MFKLRRKPPPPPPDFDEDALFSGVHWHQRWQVFQDVFTPGANPVEHMLEAMRVPHDLSGKRVLDVGAWNGCLSFECERRGAREVIALGPEEPHRSGFFRLAEAVGSTRTKYVHGSVYDLDPERLGYFDTVFFCGVLYHLRYPLLGIDNLRRVCVGEVFIETQVLDREVVLRRNGQRTSAALEQLAPELVATPLWQFYRQDELAMDPSNWFSPNSTAVLQAFESAGFAIRRSKSYDTRATFHGTVKPGLPEFLTSATGEGVYYDELVRHLFGKEKPGTKP
jgi:tRNA (mo5U34)-methyltransferase